MEYILCVDSVALLPVDKSLIEVCWTELADDATRLKPLINRAESWQKGTVFRASLLPSSVPLTTFPSPGHNPSPPYPTSARALCVVASSNLCISKLVFAF